MSYIPSYKPIDKEEYWTDDVRRWAGRDLRKAPDKIKNNKEVIYAAVTENGWALEYASERLRNEKKLVLAAIRQDGWALEYASKRLRNDKEVVMTAIGQNGRALEYASKHFRSDIEVVRGAVRQNGLALKYALEQLCSNKEVVLEAVRQNGLALQYALNGVCSDTEVVMEALKQNLRALQYASNEVLSDKDFIMEAIGQDWRALQYAMNEVRADKEVVLEALGQDGIALQYATNHLRSNKEIVLEAIRQSGLALQYTTNHLRSDKEVVLEAVQQNPISLKYALKGLNQDRECLAMAGLFDDSYDRLNSTNATRAVMSTRFSLGQNTTSYATEFALLLKEHDFFRDVILYFPNAWDKNTCDPDWTNMSHPCRGTFETCQKEDGLKKGVPKEKECCWRYSFRYQLKKAKETGGFMIQVAEWFGFERGHILGHGQQIETAMAEQEGVKVFRVYQNSCYTDPRKEDAERLVNWVKDWYDAGCQSIDLVHL